jgi:hypothetical protein
MENKEYIKDSQGRMVPISMIKEIDLTRDQVVNELIERVRKLNAHMKKEKQALLGDVKAFIDLSVEEYDVKLGGKKGNVTLRSYDGKRKIQISISDHIVFDERLQAAKVLIDEYLTDLTKDSNDDLKLIVNNAFQVNKEGKINVREILKLRTYNIKDERWVNGMRAINDSIQVVGSTEYLRFYETVKDDDQEKYKQIPLDMASL